MGRCIVVAFTLFFSWALQGQNRTEVEISNSNNSAVHKSIQATVNAFLADANSASSTGKSLSWNNVQVTSTARIRINDLWQTSPFRCLERNLNLNILNIPGGKFQLREIPVSVIDGKNFATEELVINFSADGKMEDLYFGIEQHRYRSLLQQGQSLTDFRRRQMILDFLENFRTAYNRKDLNMLEMTFSENALIIVGRVIEQTDRGIDMSGSLGKRKVELIKYNKEQYMQNLRRVFARNAFISVNFDEIEIVKHGIKKDIYGVNLKQRWRSSTYGDEGYLFLMIDFEDEAFPLIHVRAWQPQKDTPLEEVIELGDFDIIK
jgi:uncharacterized protein (DUF1330 family)